jgi:hypothetical protein
VRGVISFSTTFYLSHFKIIAKTLSVGIFNHSERLSLTPTQKLSSLFPSQILSFQHDMVSGIIPIFGGI